MKLLKAIAVVVCLILTVIYASVAVKAFKADLAEYRAENDCVTKLIARGVERSDIVTGAGTCWEKL